MSKFGKVALFLGFFWLLVCVTIIAMSLASFISPEPYADSSPLGLVKIEGPIYDGRPAIKELKKLAKSKNIKGIVLRVESPGGAVGAAQEIYAQLEHFRTDSFPVVVSFGNVAASGGYYAALPAEMIFANPGTLTGSIGVITQFMHGERLLDKIGVAATTVKSGDLKDAGSPYRAPQEHEIEYFKEVIDDTHEQFVEHVAQWRKIDLDSLRKIADGRVMTGRMAVDYGLIDTLGTMSDAVKWLSDRCGLDEVPFTLRTMKAPKPFVKELIEGIEGSLPQNISGNLKILWQSFL
ncbi:MAG: signal peptide peptidase SppA [Fibrobacter sp.]|nr:signal peptide peptidase SppA [Fibrobacter sp.]